MRPGGGRRPGVQISYDYDVLHYSVTNNSIVFHRAYSPTITSSAVAAVLKRAKGLRNGIKVQALADDFVVVDRKGKPKSAAACRDVWRDAMTRAGLGHMDYTVKDIRAKAMTDAKKAGYDIDALQVAGAHADRATTAGYIKQREFPVSTVRLTLPAA